MKRNLLVGVAVVAVIAALGIVQACTMESTGASGSAASTAPIDGAAAIEAAAADQVPLFEVDPFWPKPMPNHWLLGATIGVAVDSRDHVYIVHRNTPDQFAARTEVGAAQDPPLSECCVPAPPILEFDPEGNLVGSWGGPVAGGEYEWPDSNHGVEVDHMDNVWIGGNGQPDSHVLKFSRTGDFLMQVGRKGARCVENCDQIGAPAPAGGGRGGRGGGAAPPSPRYERNSSSAEDFGRVAKIFVDPVENEVYLADGYYNRRVAVIDADTGELKRFWGAYGNAPDDGADIGRYVPGGTPAPQFRGPVHCADMSNDRLLYVCDRAEDRIQVFQPDGTFVNEVIIAPETLSQGSTWDIAFSPDEAQRFVYLADGQNMRVYVIDRTSMEVLYSFGDGGRQPGQFFAVHSIDTDSQGNIYTTETYEGKRLQKFRFVGMGSVPSGSQYVSPWPADRR
jgi:DNA-binding beta-propeller fold protein YncE